MKDILVMWSRLANQNRRLAFLANVISLAFRTRQRNKNNLARRRCRGGGILLARRALSVVHFWSFPARKRVQRCAGYDIAFLTMSSWHSHISSPHKKKTEDVYTQSASLVDYKLFFTDPSIQITMYLFHSNGGLCSETNY